MPKVKCPKCGGDGDIELKGCLLETYQLLQKEGPITVAKAVEIAGFTGVQSTFGNRFSRLHELGLVEVIQEGIAWQYKAKKNGNGKKRQNAD